MNTNTDYFGNIIGQKAVKKVAGSLVQSHHGGIPVPHILLVAPKGCGKTEIAKCIAKGLNKKGVLFNSAGIKNTEAFMLDVVTDVIQDKDITVIFDECHELPKGVQSLMLSMLNPNSMKRNTVRYKDYEAEIDFRRQSFIFATTDPQKVDKALKSRCKLIELEEYTQSDIADIVSLTRPEIDNASLLLDIANVCRGNARDAVTLGEDIERELAKKPVGERDEFNRADWARLVDVHGIQPMGISRKEMQLLKLIYGGKQDGVSLSDLAFRIGDTPNVVRLETEAFLRKLELITVTDNSKRILTAKGKVLMDALK